MDDRPEDEVPDWIQAAKEYGGYSIEPPEKSSTERRREQEDFAAELAAAEYDSREIGIAACQILSRHYEETGEFWIYRVSGDTFDPVAVGITREDLKKKMPEGKEEIPYLHELYAEDDWEGTPQQFVAEQVGISEEDINEYAPMFAWSSNTLYHEQPELIPLLEQDYSFVELFDGNVIAPYMEAQWV